MKNASVGKIPTGKGNGRGKSGKSGLHAQAKTYMNRTRATSRHTDNT